MSSGTNQNPLINDSPNFLKSPVSLMFTVRQKNIAWFWRTNAASTDKVKERKQKTSLIV